LRINCKKRTESANGRVTKNIFYFLSLLGHVSKLHRYINRIDNLVKASNCNIVGAASINCQISLVADFGIFEMYPLEGKKERKRAERERIGVSSVQTGHSGAANLFYNPYNHNPPMKEHS
jgi:hypothetical protein